MTRTALYRHFDASGTLLYVGISLSAVARLSQHGRKPWFDAIDTMTVEYFDDRFSALRAERAAIISEKPSFNCTFSVKEKSPAHQIIKALTPQTIMESLGVTEFSIRNAKRERMFPARWYAPIKELCDERGLECPLGAFYWIGTTKA